MSDNTKNSKHYTAADIHRYLRGEMSSDEMHAIETAALDDPFLADAIEGFEMALKNEDENSMASGLGKLNKEFGERIKKPATVVPFSHSRWWQISAAAVVLVIIGFAIYNNRPGSDENPEPSLAIVEKRQTDSVSTQLTTPEISTIAPPIADSQVNQDKQPAIPAASSPQTDHAGKLISGNSKNPPGNRSAGAKIGALSSSKVNANDDLKTERAEVNVKKIQESRPEPNIDKPARQREYDAVAAKEPETVKAGNNQLSSQLKSFSGRVVDPNNKPLPYANLLIMPGRVNVVTDQSGNFSFSSKDSVVDVQVGLIGFEQRNFKLQNNISSNNLVLEPSDQKLEEVAVSGYENKRKKNASGITGKVQDAVPEIGWIEYEKYLDVNKKLSPANSYLKGEVVVSFQVKSPDSLSGFNIEKSLSKDHDKEAIRLIKNGPRWKLLSNKKTRVTVTVKF